MSLPTARVVRQAGITVVAPSRPWRELMAAAEAGMGARTRAVLGAVIGLWPVTAVVMLSGVLTWLAAMQGSP